MPRIQTTRMVRVALICLRVYLVVMLALILTKFAGSCAAIRQQPSTPANGGTNALPAASAAVTNTPPPANGTNNAPSASHPAATP